MSEQKTGFAFSWNENTLLGFDFGFHSAYLNILQYKLFNFKKNRSICLLRVGRTYFVLCGVARDHHGHDVQSLGAAAQAVDAGDVGTLVIHRLHQLNTREEGVSVRGIARHCICTLFMKQLMVSIKCFEHRLFLTDVSQQLNIPAAF